MFDRNTIEQILHLQWYDWTIGTYCFVDYDKTYEMYNIWHRAEGSNQCRLEEMSKSKSIALANFLLAEANKRFSFTDDSVEVTTCSVEGKNIAFTEQERLIISLNFKSAPLMDALLDVIEG